MLQYNIDIVIVSIVMDHKYFYSNLDLIGCFIFYAVVYFYRHITFKMSDNIFAISSIRVQPRQRKTQRIENCRYANIINHKHDMFVVH